MENLISIIVVNYNGKKWLKKLFDSLLCQTYENFELIFVDNGSRDNSLEFIRKNYSDKRIKIIESDKNLGFSGGNNLGVKNSNGEYILLLNSDVWIRSDFLEKLVTFYRDNHFDVVAPYEKDYFEKKEFEKNNSTIDLLGHPICFSFEKKKSFYLSGACLFFEKKLYVDSCGLDSNFFMYSEEVDWFWRLNLLKKSYAYVDDLFFYHAGSTGSEIKYNIFLWRNQNVLQMLLKNYKWYNLLWILPLYFVQNILEIVFFILILRPKIAIAYLQAWWFNVANFKKTMQKRTFVQKNRLIGDFTIMQKMHVGFAKAHHLLAFYGKR